MKIKLLVIIGVILLILAAYAGCVGSGASSKKKLMHYSEVSATIPGVTGWLESDWQTDNQDPYIVGDYINLNINTTDKLTYIKLTIAFEDTDVAHADTDDGSDPDDIIHAEILVGPDSNCLVSDPGSGTTDCVITLELNATWNGTGDDKYFSGQWRINVEATCHGGKDRFPHPGPNMIVYVDEGLAYSVMGEYKYLEKN